MILAALLLLAFFIEFFFLAKDERHNESLEITVQNTKPEWDWPPPGGHERVGYTVPRRHS